MNIALIGYGKMGKEIEKILLAQGDTVGLIIDKDNPEDLNAEKLSGIDAAIEFSTPHTAYDNVITALRCGVSVVCGTTAWLDRLPEVKALCEETNGAFFYASNYSIGVNLMFKVNKVLASLMNKFPQYDVTVEEIHHTAKLDAPSGTAVTLAEGVIENLDRKDNWVLGCSTNSNDLNVGAVRRSVVPGTHTVTWESEIDQIAMTHTAKGRAGFALGAVVAAKFLVGKKGCYSMEDLF